MWCSWPTTLPNGATGAIPLAGRPRKQDVDPGDESAMMCEATGAGNSAIATDTPAIGLSTPRALPRRAEPLGPSEASNASALHLQLSSLDAIAHIQAILQTNAMLVQQSATLEQQIQTLLVERIVLVERIAALEEQLAAPSSQYADRSTACHVVPFRPLVNLPAILHHKRLEVIGLPQSPDLAKTVPALQGRFPHPMVSDEETLLGSTIDLADADSAVVSADDFPAQRRYTETNAVENGSLSRDYVLIAHPFARFTDLGGFQSAVQALPSIRNVRVRRFAQGVLEMRVDYDGATPLADLLRRLAQPVEEVIHEAPTRLRIRLTPLRERGFPALS